MDALSCRSPARCASCAYSDRSGACLLAAQVDLALEAPSLPALVAPARRAAA